MRLTRTALYKTATAATATLILGVLSGVGPAHAHQPILTLEEYALKKTNEQAFLKAQKKKHIEKCLRTLREGDANQRCSAAYELGLCPPLTPPVRDALVATLSEEGELRSVAVFSLAELGDRTPPTVNTLLSFVQDSQGVQAKDQRVGALFALGRLGITPAPVLKGLAGIVREDETRYPAPANYDYHNTPLSHYAMDMLGKLGAPAIPTLISLLEDSENDPNGYRRSDAAYTLAAIATDIVPALDAIIGTLDDPDKVSDVRKGFLLTEPKNKKPYEHEHDRVVYAVRRLVLQAPKQAETMPLDRIGTHLIPCLERVEQAVRAQHAERDLQGIVRDTLASVREIAAQRRRAQLEQDRRSEKRFVPLVWAQLSLLPVTAVASLVLWSSPVARLQFSDALATAAALVPTRCGGKR